VGGRRSTGREREPAARARRLKNAQMSPPISRLAVPKTGTRRVENRDSASQRLRTHRRRPHQAVNATGTAPAADQANIAA
jgi:hypothetical protein